MPEKRYEDPEETHRFPRDEADSGNLPDFQSEGGLPIIPLTRFGQHLQLLEGTDDSSCLIGFPNTDAVERFAEWISQQALVGDQPMGVFVLNRPRLPFSSTNQGLHISFNGTVTVPTDRPIVLIVHDFGYLHNTGQRMLRHLVDGDGCIDTPLAKGSLLIGTFIKGQHGWIDPGFGGPRYLIKDA